MLFAKRELKDALGTSLSQRFVHHVGRYLSASNDNQSKNTAPFKIADCYTFLGDNPDNPYFERDKLQQTTQQVIRDYHEATGFWLNQEQVAFAAIWQDSKQQAAILQTKFKRHNISTSILYHDDAASLLCLSFIAESLGITELSKPCSHFSPIKSSACSRTLNLPLDETNMPEIEAIGREVRQSCQDAHLKQGIKIDDLQTCWRLKLRYEGGKNSLILKCMPIEMLRETFETQHLQKFGASDEKRVIIIEELKIEVGVAAETIAKDEQETSFYSKQWLSQWHTVGGNQAGHWIKQKNPVIERQFSWLFCPILEGILDKLIAKQADSTTLGFFLTNHQKGVDEVATRN